MLVGFAVASIVTSVVTGLTGVSVMPADVHHGTAQVAHVAQVEHAATGSSSARGWVGSSPIGDAPASSGAGAAGPSSAAVFGSIRAVDPAALPGFLGAHASQLDQLLTSPPAAGDVSRLWGLLDPSRQAALVSFAPHVIGNLEGVPYAIRGKANRLDLDRTITSARDRLRTERGKAERVALKRRLTTLGNVETALKKKKNGATRTLVSLDTSKDARAAIVVGDLRTARYVGVLVPGMYMSVGEQVQAWAGVAQNLYDQETGFLKRLRGSRTSRVPGVAVVAWIGYQTPVLMNIGGLDLARQGADGLERTLVGIQSLRASDPPYLSVFAHSYGSTAALLALERGTVEVDAVALMGSPGSDAQSVAQLGVRGGNVFVGEAPLDPIVNSAFFGSDPGSPSYGAKKMGVGGAVDPITHTSLSGSSGHNEYFTAGTECMRNLALIGIGRGDLVIGGGRS